LISHAIAAIDASLRHYFFDAITPPDAGQITLPAATLIRFCFFFDYLPFSISHFHWPRHDISFRLIFSTFRQHFLRRYFFAYDYFHFRRFSPFSLSRHISSFFQATGFLFADI
jgi:hypothetical protein